MRIFIIILTASLAMVTFSNCKEKPKAKTSLDILFDEVMEIHDEVMPLMDDMARNEKQLKTFLDEKSAFNDSLQNQIKTNISNLATTSDAMMEWMYQFSDPERDEAEKAKDYLENQKLKITKVSKAMKMAYEKSSILLQDLNQDPG